MSGRRICILTPGAVGSNPRVVKEADALAAHGYAVEVVCTRTLAEVDARDEDVLAGAAWRARRIDLTDRRAWRARRVAQTAAAKLFDLTGVGALADRGVSAFSSALWAAARDLDADLYVAHYPAALPVAARCAARRGARFAFDAEDYHPGDLAPSPEARTANRRLHALEARWLPGCAYVTAASPGIAEAYEAAYGIARPATLLNVFPKSQAVEAPAGRAPGADRSIYWFSQVIGPDRGLECAVRAIAQAQTRPHLHLRGMISPNYERALRDLAASMGVQDRLHLAPPGPPSEMARLAAGHDAGLVAETGQTENRRIALTNKQFTYLMAGLPSVLSDIPAHRQIAEAFGEAACLYETENAASLAAALDTVLGDEEGLARRRCAALRLGRDRFNWEIEQTVLLDCVDRSLA